MAGKPLFVTGRNLEQDQAKTLVIQKMLRKKLSGSAGSKVSFWRWRESKRMLNMRTSDQQFYWFLFEDVMKIGHECKMIHQDWSNTSTSSTLIPDRLSVRGYPPVIFYSSSAQIQIHAYWWSDHIHMRRVNRAWQANRGKSCVRSSAGAALTHFLKEDLVILIMSTNSFRIRTRLHLQVYAWERD